MTLERLEARAERTNAALRRGLAAHRRLNQVLRTTVEQLLNARLADYEEETYLIEEPFDVIALYHALRMFTQNPSADDNEGHPRQVHHEHLQDLILDGRNAEGIVDWYNQVDAELEQPFDPENHFGNAVLVLGKALCSAPRGPIGPRQLSDELNSQWDAWLEEPRSANPSDMPSDQFTEHVKKSIHYFVAWWRLKNVPEPSDRSDYDDQSAPYQMVLDGIHRMIDRGVQTDRHGS